MHLSLKHLERVTLEIRSYAAVRTWHLLASSGEAKNLLGGSACVFWSKEETTFFELLQ